MAKERTALTVLEGEQEQDPIDRVIADLEKPERATEAEQAFLTPAYQRFRAAQQRLQQAQQQASQAQQEFQAADGALGHVFQVIAANHKLEGGQILEDGTIVRQPVEPKVP